MTVPSSRRSIGRLSTIVYRAGTDVIAKGAMFVVTVVAARQLSRPEFATFALASTAGWLASVAADFGMQMHLARAVAQAPHASRALLVRWWPVRVATGLLTFGAALASLRYVGFGAGDTVLSTALFVAAYAVGGITEFVFYLFRGYGRSDLESTLTLLQRSLMLVLALAALTVSPGVLRLATAMLAAAVMGACGALFAARTLTLEARNTGTFPHRSRAREFIADVAPIGAGILLSALYFRIDVLLLQQWSGEAAVAVYNAVFRLVEALRLFPAAVLAVALPALSRADDRRPLVVVAVPLTAGACLAAALGWLVAPRLVPLLYGAAFAEGVPVFRVLLFSLPLMALNYALTHQLIGWHGHRAYASICASALGVNLLLNWRWIPELGMRGAAWSTLATEAVVSLGCLLALRQIEPGAAGAALRRIAPPMGAES